jgi:hypothetical protein
MVLVMPPVSPYFLGSNLRARHGVRPQRRVSTWKADPMQGDDLMAGDDLKAETHRSRYPW